MCHNDVLFIMLLFISNKPLPGFHLCLIQILFRKSHYSIQTIVGLWIFECSAHKWSETRSKLTLTLLSSQYNVLNLTENYLYSSIGYYILSNTLEHHSV